MIYFASNTRAKIPAANGAEAKTKTDVTKIIISKKKKSKRANQMFLYDHRCTNHEDLSLSNEY